MSERCKHEMLAGECGDCRQPVRRTQQTERPRPGPWFAARRDSDCDGCGGLIDQGDQIRSDGEGGWLCTDCGQEAELDE